MKFIVIGLGNFGSSLSIKLMEGGHEVIGVDNDPTHINQHVSRLTHTLQMDSTNEFAVQELPLADADGVIIAIGEDSSASITTAALFKKHVPSCRLIARATSEIHKTIFEAMGIKEIVNPESEYADRFAQALTIAGNLNAFFLNDTFEIAEFRLPKSFIGKTNSEVNIEGNWKVSLVTIIRDIKRKNLLGQEIQESQILGAISDQDIFKEEDRLVLFGAIKDLEKMMNSDL